MNSYKRIIISCSYANSIINLRGKLIESLSKKHQVSLITPQIQDKQIRITLQDWGVSIFEIELQPNKLSVFSDIKYMIRVRSLIRQIKPDIFFAYTIKPICYGNLAASTCGVNLVASLFTGLGYMFRDVPSVTFSQRLLYVLLKISLRINKSTTVFFQNKDDHKELSKLRILSRNCIVHIVNGSGVDLNKFSYHKPDIAKISFIMIAKLVNAKGIREFYESAKIVKRKYGNVTFHLLGIYEENGTDSITEVLFNEIKANQIVEYHGWVNDVRSFIKDSSVMVLPSYREGIPRSALEAMSMGRPLITANSIGCRETILSGPEEINGFMVNPKDINSLADRMEFFIKNPEKIIEYGLNGRRFAVNRFDVNKVNEEMVNALNIA